MEKWIFLLGAAVRCLCCSIPIQADVVFEPVGGELEGLVLFAAILVVIILLVTIVLLLLLKRKGKK